MMDQTPEVSSIRYYCTAGNGMEHFLIQEVKAKLAAKDVCQIPGKVLFSSSAGVDKVRGLKSAERIFLLIRQDSSVKLPSHISSAKAASVLQARLLGDCGEWHKAVTTWTRLQWDIKDTTVNTSRCEDADSTCHHEQDGTTPTEKKGGNEENDGQTLQRKRKRDDDEELATDREGPSPPPECPVSVSFRISCKCTGALSRRLNSQELSRIIAACLSRELGWKADLKNPLLEVNVNLSDDHCLLGIPLTSCPLAKRSYIKTTGLRSTVAWAMVSLADVKPGSFVVDPMCGVGTILLEGVQEHRESFFLGMDIDDSQLQKARDNILFANLSYRTELLKASSMELPLPSDSVDAVVCDLPFGKKFGTKTDMAANLPLIIREMERVLCVGGSLVLLTSPQLSCLLKKLQTHQGSGPSSTKDHLPQSGPQGGLSSPPSSMEHLSHQTPVLEAGRQAQEAQPLSSLKLCTVHRVSLGAIDGLIHKYIKMQT